ncbi:uncharacterized protein [Amphiura filiformis]|uniref:uncharacterized protein n=1 Tax=Amphiura filiformis TaxID=82378 RepID=UPI003B20F720
MATTFWTHFLCIGFVLITAENHDEPNSPKQGEILPGIAFEEIMHMFADVLNQNTFKGSLAEACLSARRILDAVSSQDSGSFEFDLDSICLPIRESLTTGEDVDIYKEVCELLEFVNGNYYGYNYDEDRKYSDINIRDGYRWLLKSFILLTFDSSWYSPWRHYLVSPHELIHGAFKMDWKSGNMDCDLMSQELRGRTGKEFLDRAIRNSFFEALRYRHFPRNCSVSNDEPYDYDEEAAYTSSIIDNMISNVLGHVARDCNVLSNALDDFERGDRTAINEILNRAKDNYYRYVFDDMVCDSELLSSYRDNDPDFEEAIANYTGFSSTGQLCTALHNIYWFTEHPEYYEGNIEDIQHEYNTGMSIYGYHHSPINDPSSQYTSLLSLSSKFLTGNSTLSALNAVCSAFDDFGSEDRQLCDALSIAAISGHWKAFKDICEKDFLQRYDHNAWSEKFHANQPFNIIFNSFFLFTFNGDWNMPYRHEFISITKLLRQAYDLWPNYDTICQNVAESLDQPANVLVEGAIMHSFKYYIRDHILVTCALPLGPDGYTTTTLPAGQETPSMDKASAILADIFQFLLHFDSKEAMCSSLSNTLDEIRLAAERATRSFLRILEDETKCREFLKIHRYKEGFTDAIYRFTGYHRVRSFCNYLVQTFTSRTPEINTNRFQGKTLHEPFDVYLNRGDVFDGVNFTDLLPVAVNLLNSATVREGINLLCSTFQDALDQGRSDRAICEALISQQRNFQEECNVFNWLTADSGGSNRQRNIWPWFLFNRWLPDWFYDYSGFDHIFYMYTTESLPMKLDLPQMLNRILSFSDSSPYEAFCDRLSDIIVSQDDTLTIKHILDTVIDFTLDHLSRMAPKLCLAENMPFPDESTHEKHSTTTPSNKAKVCPPYDQTYWKHLHLGPVEGPMVGKLFAYLNTYVPIELMCEILCTEQNINTDILKTKSLVSLREVYTDSWHCRLFAAFIDSERQKAHKDIIPTLAEEMGFISTDSMCTAMVEAFNAGDTELDFDWSNVTAYYKYYYPKEFHPPTKGKVLPGVSFYQLVQMIGNIYNNTLRSSLTTICRILHIESHSNDFPFEYELCILANDAVTNKKRFQEYCYSEAAQYQTYFDHADDNIGYDDIVYPDGFPDHIFEEQSWAVSPEITALNDFAKARFGLDINNTYSVCEVGGEMLKLSMDGFIQTVTDGLSLVVKTFIRNQYDMICSNDINIEDIPTSNSTDFPSEFPAHLLAVLADYQSSEEFCNQLLHLIPTSNENRGTCIKETDDPILQDIVNKITSNALLVIKDKIVCGKVVDVFFTYFNEDLPVLTGHDTSNTLCTTVVDALTQPPDQASYSPPPVPSNVAEILETFEPFQEPGQILPFLTFDKAAELYGYLYNQPSLYDSLAYLCEHYNSTLFMIGDVPQEIRKVCNAFKDDGDINHAVSICKAIVVPLIYGSEYPIGLRQIDPLFEIQKILLNLAGGSIFMNTSTVTSAIETLINSEMNLKDLINGVLDDLLPSALQTAYDICDDWDAIDTFLKLESEFDGQRINAMWRLIGTLSGFATSAGEFDCDTLQSKIAAEHRTSRAVDTSTVVEDLKEKFWSYMTDINQCQVAVNSFMEYINHVNASWSSSDDTITHSNLFTNFTRYADAREFCKALVELVDIKDNCDESICTMADPQCGTNGQTFRNPCDLKLAMCSNPDLQLQHAGECQSGMCNGDRDCNGDCQGTAIVNECLYCVNGNTGRASDFGRDKCGVCISSDASYRLGVDCNGDCGGVADYDECGECTGGKTTKARSINDHRLDCNGVCDGTWVLDGCDICGPNNGHTDSYSMYKDCSGTCHPPGSDTAGWARRNTCDECVGGTTGLDESYGMNACGECRTDIMSCAGCDGVPYSGKEEDGCGVCEGDGTSCVKVSRIHPTIAPSGQNIQFVIRGAGLNHAGTKCVFDLDGSRTEVIGTSDGPQMITCGDVRIFLLLM